MNCDKGMRMCKSIELLRIVEWLSKMKIENYTINDDLSVDVDGHVWLNDKGLIEIPVQFNIVGGWFSCENNLLTSLKGCPKEVGGWFLCDNNQLTSLEGIPTEVGGSFNCSCNKVKFRKEDVKKVCWVGGEVIV